MARINHSSSSGFMTTPNSLIGQPSSYHRPGQPQTSNQMSALTPMQPLQPIRTQPLPGQGDNLLDMFDPLSDELLTPPIHQGQSKVTINCIYCLFNYK